MKIAVLGGGNGSYAAAADLTEAGHEVRLWRRNVEALNALRDAGGLRVKDIKGERNVVVHKLCENIGDAVIDTQLIVAPTPAFAQADIARALAPHLVDDQVIYLPPGSFGSFLMMRELRDAGCTANVGFAETGTLPWLTRKHADNTIAITTRFLALLSRPLRQWSPWKTHCPAR